MIVNKTNYRSIAQYITNNPHLISQAQSFNSLTGTINHLIQEGEIPNTSKQIRLQHGTLNTIVYAVMGALDAQPAPQSPYRLELVDSMGNKSYLTITPNTVRLNTKHCQESLSNMQYDGDAHYDLMVLYKAQDYDGINQLITHKTLRTIL